MAVTESGIFLATLQDCLDGTKQHAYGTDDFKIMLLTDNPSSTITPNFSTHSALTDISTDDVGTSGTYTAGGVSLAGTSLTIASSLLQWKANDPSFTSTSISSLGCGIFNEDDATAPVDAVLCILYYGNTVTSNGTFTVDFPTDGFIQLPYS